MGSEPIHVGGRQAALHRPPIHRTIRAGTTAREPAAQGHRGTVFPRQAWEAFTTGWYSLDWDPEARRYKKWYAACGRRPVGRRELAALLRGVGGRAGLGEARPGAGRVPRLPRQQHTDRRREAHLYLPRPARPAAERFKMIRGFPEKTKVGTSPDGIRWNLPDRPVSDLPPGWDTAKQAWWTSASAATSSTCACRSRRRTSFPTRSPARSTATRPWCSPR